VATSAMISLAARWPDRLEDQQRNDGQAPAASASVEARYVRAVPGVSRPTHSLAGQAIAGFVVAYALSPIDLIPDFVPVLGYLDDLLLVPAGLALAVKLIPEPVMNECRERAQLATDRPTNWVAAIVIVSIWLAAAALVIYLVAQAFDLI
jgi:uncharacterized membrane protein YkvA (DUF1232 family)